MTNKAKFKLLVETLEKGGWDFMGWKVNAWQINKGLITEKLFLNIKTAIGQSSTVYFDLATILGQEKVRKIIFGEEIVCVTCGESGSDEDGSVLCEHNYDMVTDLPAFEYHTHKMTDTGEPPQWLDYIIVYLKGKEGK